MKVTAEDIAAWVLLGEMVEGEGSCDVSWGDRIQLPASVTVVIAEDEQELYIVQVSPIRKPAEVLVRAAGAGVPQVA
jgi:hypothetical protein